MNKCLDKDLCRISQKCLRIIAEEDCNTRYMHFWNGNNDINCLHYIDSEFNIFENEMKKEYKC